MAAPSVVQSAAASGAGITSQAATFGGGGTATAGNLLMVWVNYPTVTQIQIPSGYTWRRRFGDASLFTKIAAGGETGVTITFSASQSYAHVCVMEISGSETDGSIQTWVESVPAAASTQTIPSVTPIAGLDCLLVAVATANPPRGVSSAPSGYTQRADLANGGDVRLGVYTKAQTNPSGSYSSSISYTGGTVTGRYLHVVVCAPQAASTITWVQSASDQHNSSSNVTSLTAVFGATPVEGHLLTLEFIAGSSTSPTLPSGWVKRVDVLSTSDADMYYTIATKVAGASEPTSVNVTFASDNKCALGIREWVGGYVSIASAQNAASLLGQVTDTYASVTPATDEHVGVISFAAYINAQALGQYAEASDYLATIVGNSTGASTVSHSSLKVIRRATGAAYAPSFGPNVAVSSRMSAQMIINRTPGVGGNPLILPFKATFIR